MDPSESGRELERVEQTRRELAQAREQLAAGLEIHRAVAGHLQRRPLFAAVAAALERIGPSNRVTLLLPSSDPASLAVYAAHGSGGTKFFEGESIPREGTMPGWVVEHQRPLVATSAEAIRDRFPISHAKLQREGMQSVAVLPLSVGGRSIGALSLMSEKPGAWDEVPSTLFEEIGAAVGVALDASVTFEEVQRLRDEMATGLEINRAVAQHLDRDALFATLAKQLDTLLPSDRFGIELPIPGDRLHVHVLTPNGVDTRIDELPAAGTACHWVGENREWLVASSRDELRDRFPVTFEVMLRENMESLCAMPLVSEDRSRGVLFFMASRPGAYRDVSLTLLEQVAGSVAVALDHCLAYEELRSLRDQLAAENVYLQEEIRQGHDFEEIVGRSASLREALRQVELVAPMESTVLIVGETGTGKELFARALHSRSRRSDKPLIKVNCAAIPTGLVESELFGHEKGAFTGATARRIGRFELADGGTIFLDEIGELPLEAQVKLLRVLQEREFERVGGSATIRTDVRVIAATNRDLAKEVAAGRFREELYYRLSVFPLALPPLRDRPDDVELLAHYFLRRDGRRVGREISGISAASIRALKEYAWPGNVRELENVIERALILSSGPMLELPADFMGVSGKSREVTARAEDRESPPARATEKAPVTLQDAQRQHLLSALERCNWIIEGARGAARELDLHPNTLRSKLKRLGLERPKQDRISKT